MATTTITYPIINADRTVSMVTETVDVSVVNGPAILAKIGAALAGNATYLGLASPSTAQNTAQVQALTRQVNALIRLVGNQLDATTGT